MYVQPYVYRTQVPIYSTRGQVFAQDRIIAAVRIGKRAGTYTTYVINFSINSVYMPLLRRNS